MTRVDLIGSRQTGAVAVRSRFFLFACSGAAPVRGDGRLLPLPLLFGLLGMLALLMAFAALLFHVWGVPAWTAAWLAGAAAVMVLVWWWLQPRAELAGAGGAGAGGAGAGIREALGYAWLAEVGLYDAVGGTNFALADDRTYEALVVVDDDPRRLLGRLRLDTLTGVPGGQPAPDASVVGWVVCGPSPERAIPGGLWRRPLPLPASVLAVVVVPVMFALVAWAGQIPVMLWLSGLSGGLLVAAVACRTVMGRAWKRCAVYLHEVADEADAEGAEARPSGVGPLVRRTWVWTDAGWEAMQPGAKPAPATPGAPWVVLRYRVLPERPVPEDGEFVLGRRLRPGRPLARRADGF